MMIQVRSIDDLYPALDELISELELAGHSRLAAVLHHRVHLVAWTTGSELFDELYKILTDALKQDEPRRLRRLKEQIESVLQVIGNAYRKLDT